MTEKNDIKSLLRASIGEGARQAEAELLKAELDRHKIISSGFIRFLNEKPFDPKLVEGKFKESYLASDEYKKKVEKRTGWKIEDFFYLTKYNEELVQLYFKEVQPTKKEMAFVLEQLVKLGYITAKKADGCIDLMAISSFEFRANKSYRNVLGSVKGLYEDFGDRLDVRHFGMPTFRSQNKQKKRPYEL